VLQCVAVCWSGLHRAVECCSVLQCVAMVRIRTSLVRWKSNRGVFVCVASVFVCVCVCERERECVCVCGREKVCASDCFDVGIQCVNVYTYI